MRLTWFECFRGNQRFLPGSNGKAVDQLQKELYPLNAQIAVATGRPHGNLADLRMLIEKLINKSQIVCEMCGKSIFIDGHKEDCIILLAYNRIESTEPQNPFLKRKDQDLHDDWPLKP